MDPTEVTMPDAFGYLPTVLHRQHAVTKAEMEQIADESFAVIERDSGQTLDERMRRVVKHWMVRAMTDVRNSTIDHQANLLDAALQATKSGRDT